MTNQRERSATRGRDALNAGNNGGGGIALNAGPEADPAPPLQGKWRTRVCAWVALLWGLSVFLLALGALAPNLPFVGTLGTLFESFFSLHLFLAGLVGLVLANWARRAGDAKGLGSIAAVLAVTGTIGAAVPIFSYVKAANHYGAVISWGEHLRASTSPAASPDQTRLYATVGGRALYLDVYWPPRPVSSTANPAPLSSPVLMIHGGGFGKGERSDGRVWDRWFAARGYTVFDADYRLDPPPSWQDAAGDAECALNWVAMHASEYHVVPDHLLITGQSAGGTIALQATYGLLDGTFTSSCGGNPPIPKAVFALYPPDDFILGWDRNTQLGSARGRDLCAGYLGGSPDQFPDRYRAASAVFHVRPDWPPTLVAAGEHDHLVPFSGHQALAARLSASGVANVLVSIPYSDHGYDLLWSGLGAQITRRALVEFLTQYLPPTVQP